MKNFLSKNWKRILILIAGIFIGINIISKCVAPHTLINEYAKYGPDIDRKSTSIAGSKVSGESTVSGETSGETGNFVSDIGFSSPLNSEMTKVVAFIGGGLLIAVILTELANKKPSSGKKK